MRTSLSPHSALWMHFTKTQLFNTDIVQDGTLKCVFCDRSPHGMPIAHQPRVFVTLSCLLPSVSDTSATDKISEDRHGFFTCSLAPELIDEHFQLGGKKTLKIPSFSYLLFFSVCVCVFIIVRVSKSHSPSNPTKESICSNG